MAGFGLITVATTLHASGCYPEEGGAITVSPSQLLPAAQAFQAEVSVAVVPPGNVCPTGAAFAGFNDGLGADAQSYIAQDGLSVAMDPATCPNCTWQTQSGRVLTDLVRARFPGVLATRGDPELAVTATDRVLYASLASSGALADGPRDTLVVFRTDSCGTQWDVSRLPLTTIDGDVSELDRPSIFVDPANPMRVIVGLAKETWSYYSVSDDGGVTFSQTLFPMPRSGQAMETPWFTRYGTEAGSRIGAVFVRYALGNRNVTYYFTSTVDPTIPNSWSPPVEIDRPRPALFYWSGTRTREGGAPRNDRQPTVISTPGRILVAFPSYWSEFGTQVVAVHASVDGGRSWKVAYSSLDQRTGQARAGSRDHDAAWPLLAGNSLDQNDTRVLLAWYDTRDDFSEIGTRLGVYAATSRSGGTAWSVDSPRSLRGALPPFAPFVAPGNNYYGDYFGCGWVATRDNPQDGKHLCVWMESRAPMTTRLYSATVSY